MAFAPKAAGRGGAFAVALTACLFAPFTADAADTEDVRDFSRYRPSAAATRIDPSEAPKIDGNPSDAVWSKAPAIEDFYQLEPDTGQPGTERTVARVLYDENAIYVAFWAYDSDPSGIKSGAKARDTNVQLGDVVRLYLDPGMTRRDGYAFEVNPYGGRLDAIIQNNTDYIDSWDTIWTAKTTITNEGWFVEMAIPFRSISYDASRSDWGFDLFRLIRRKSERMRWSSINVAIPSVDISQSGTLTGVTGIKPGIGLDIQGYASLRYKREWEDPRDDDVELVESANAYYKITPELTATATINPDFSDTPLDQRRINTSRFSLFLPETRDFFLQDAASFEFGGQAFFDDPNGLPYFSRNVGLVEGQPVPIIAGGKLSGSYKGLGVGAFTAMTADSGAIPGQPLSVIRLTMPLLDELRAGLIYTNGDPTGFTTNSLAGGDFQYRNSHVLGGNTLQADVSYQRSFSNVFGEDHEIGVGISYPNEPWFGRFRFKELGEDFNPALGFVNRIGIRSYHLDIGKRIRYSNGPLRWFEFGGADNLVTGLDNVNQSRFSVGWVGVFTRSSDLAFLNYLKVYESVPALFSFGDDAVVPAGNYHWDDAELYFESFYGRKVQVTGDVICCEFYNGEYLVTDIAINYRPNETLEIIPRYLGAFIDLPTGSTDMQVFLFNLNFNFTPDMQIKTETQFDNVSRNFTFAARYRWEFSPGSEIFVAFGENALITENLTAPHYASQTSQASIRVGHTLRF